MKLPCEMIQDLLPLYIDQVCSLESRKAVEEHLSQCPTCRQYQELNKLPDIMIEIEAESEPVIRERVMKNGFRKLRRRWILSILSILLLFPLMLLVLMGVHEYRGEGIAFTNLNEIFFVKRFIGLIEHHRFEEAASLLDFESKYQEIQEILGQKPEDYLPSIELHTIDGKSWVVKADWEDQYHIQGLFEDYDSTQIWMYLISNNVQSILIPESIWTQLSQIAGDGTEYDELQDTYFPINTAWGRFYIRREYRDILMEANEITAELLFQLADLIPYEIYQAAQESLEQRALEIYKDHQEYYATVASMTQEEYVRSMRNQFSQLLENCYTNGITIQNSHISETYRIAQDWSVEISAIERQPDEQSTRVSYDFMIQNGKLRVVGSSHSSELASDPIAQALRLTCP